MKQSNILGPVNAASSTVSVAFDLGDLDKYAIQVVFSGGAGNLVGTLTLEACADVEHPPSNFTTVLGSSQAVTASAGHVWNVQGGAYRWVRARWVFTSGTGNITMSICAKENVIKGA